MNEPGFIRGWRHDVTTASQLAHARPAYAAGIRAAIATVAPLLFTAVLPAGASTWMSLAGLNGALIDRGGPYRMRAMVMSALAVGSAIAVFIGSVLGGHVVAAVISTFIIALLCGMLRAWTEIGPGFGVTILVSFAIALAIPSPSIEAAAVRGVFILAGGAWAMLLAIVLWPLRPYRPVRLRIAECYRAIARYVEAATMELGGGPHDPVALTSHVAAVRTSIEAARTTLALSRRGRSAESGRGERLLVLHEVADQMFAHLIALLELSAADFGAVTDPDRIVIAATLGEIAATARSVANAIEAERDLPPIVVTWDGRGVAAVNATMGEIVDRIADYATAASELTATLNSGSTAPVKSAARIGVAMPPEPSLFSLDGILHPATVTWHHALRVAIVTTLAVLLTHLLGLNHGYWVTLTVVVILQPFAAMTRQKALQRIGGTILGGIAAAGLSALFQGEGAVLALIAVFTMLCVALLPLNYGAYAVFGTPAFVLLAETSAGDWHLAGIRIINTLIGGALAMAGAAFFWPGEERSRLPELAAAAFRANAEFLRRTIRLFSDQRPDLGVLRDARRDVGNAALNAEDSFQRVISEHRGRPDELEPIMASLIYVRRLAASTAALAIAAQSATRPAPAAMQTFGDASVRVLDDLAEATLARRAPAPFPPIGSVTLPDASTAPETYQSVNRIARQLKLMHDAVARWPRPN